MRQKLSVVVFFLILLFTAVTEGFALCGAEDCTPKSGVINNEVWTIDDSPICLEGDVTVVNLTIGPGVIVESCGDFAITVTGKLVAAGGMEDLIEFRDGTGTTGWQGIKIQDSATNCQLSYCAISDSINGGLEITNSTPVINNVSIFNNTRNTYGAGLHVSLSSSPSDQLVIENTTISNNKSYGHGGGIYANLAAGSMILRRCYINNNTATYPSSSTGNHYGGGIYTTAAGGLKLENCEVNGNMARSYNSGTNSRAYGYGGGLYIIDGNVDIKNSFISTNTGSGSCSGTNCRAYAYGGGIYAYAGNLRLLNSIVNSNSLAASYSTYGGGIFNNLSTVQVTNCNIVYNVPDAVYTSTGMTQIRNSIIYFNPGAQLVGTAIVDHSDVQGGYAGEGNIDMDPLFENIFTYRVRCDYSPCMDAGSEYPWENDACFPPSCGTERNDMGAYGGPDACGWCANEGSICLGPCETPAVGDFNADGDVDAADLFLFTNNYGIN